MNTEQITGKDNIQAPRYNILYLSFYFEWKLLMSKAIYIVPVPVHVLVFFLVLILALVHIHGVPTAKNW